jgi:hypothetical protein
MENYLFIPINSLNFNNILSSESISPASFYEKRGFGFKRFERINANPLPNSVLAYTKVVAIETPESDREEYPIYLAVPESYFPKDCKETITDKVTVLQTDASIHINWQECFFIAKNEEDRKKLAAGTKRSLEIKNADLYLKKFYLVSDYNFETINWNQGILENIRDYKNYNQNQVIKDQKLNKLKGLVYGFVSGKVKEQPSELTKGKRYFQDFINSFSVLMNELSVLSSDSKKGKVDKVRINKELDYLTVLKDKVSILFGGNEELEVDNALTKAFAIDASQIEQFKSLNYNKTRNSIYSIVSAFIKERNTDLYAIDELMNTLIQKAKSFVRYNSFSLYKALDESFNEYRVLINNKISDYEKEVSLSSSFDSIPFLVGDDYSITDYKLKDFNTEEKNSFTVITKELLSRLELSTTDEIAQKRLDIIQHIAEELTKSFKKDSEELEFLRRLYKSLKTVGVGFKISETTNSSLQSLACFLSRYQEMDKLQDFMEKNKYQNYGMTYALWGSAYGYANLSKILLSSIDSSTKVLNLLANYTANITIKKSLDDEMVSNYLNAKKVSEAISPVFEWNMSDEKNENSGNSDSIKISFHKTLKNNPELSKKAEWLETLVWCYDFMMKNNFEGALFDNSYKAKEFESLLIDKKSKGDLKGFGKAKIQSAVSEFLKFIANNE